MVVGLPGARGDVKDSPTFIKCQISLLATSNGKKSVVFTKPCNSEEQLYSNAQHISHVAMDWDTKYTTPEDVPSKPSYIRSYRFGIISAGVQGTLKNGNGVSVDSISIPCTSRENQESPVEALRCSNHTYLGATHIGHGYRVEATAKASSGGYKERSGSWPSRRMFAGKTASQSASVTFDLRAPTHCADPGRCLDGGGLAVDVGREIDKSVSSTRKLRWFGWNDADSGLNTFTYEVYPLAPDSNGLLTEKSRPVAKDTSTAFDTLYPTYTLPGPGMYSVILEVTDNVGNSACARGLLLWDSQSSVTVTDQPMLVTGATPSGGGVVVVWMTSPVNLLRPLVIKWRGHFENAFHHNNKLLNAAKPWLKGLDDREGDLTVDAIPNVLGIVKFTFGRSDISRTTPVTWVDVRLNEHYELRATIADGGSIRVYVEAYDIMGNSATDSLVVGVDSTSPQVQSHTFEKNIGSGESKLPHSSRFTLFVLDKESGISTIHYHVTDVKDDSDIWTGIVSGQLETEDKHKCRDDGPCVCTPHNGCYRRNQVLYVDHCWLVHSVGHAIAVTATVYNHAGLSTTTTVKLGLLKGLYGINKCSGYTSASKLGAGAIVGIVTGTLFLLLVWTAACLVVVFVWTRRRRNEPYWPHNFSDFRHTLRQTVQFGHNATPNPNEFQLNSNRQQQAPPMDAADGEDVDMATDDVADWKMPAEKVVLGKRLSNATGRFADIYEATVKLNSVRQKVVAKKVKHGGNADSILLMTAKMNFWATACPKHENILHFVGAVPSGE
ncbi:hypothetical protein LSAT2_027773 [Lamellibrachia satsuma]|nr:hypothetical protein LSAT2_027773 [Lamellibrachia satsuma]